MAGESKGNIIESFFVALGYQIDTKALEEFKTHAQTAAKTAMKIGAVVVGAATGLGIFTRSIAKTLGDTADFAELNNISARSVEALGKVALEHDSSIEGMRGSIQSLNGMVGQAALGLGRGAMLFKRMGLTARDSQGNVKSLDRILEDVADRMSGLSRQENIAMANKLGIDPMLVKTLEKGSRHLRELREEAEAMNPLTEEDYRLADEVDRLFIKAQGTIGRVTKMLGAKLLPFAKRVLTFYLDWVKAGRKNNDMLSVLNRILNVTGSVLGSLWDWLVRITTAVINALKWLSQFQAVWVALSAVIAILLAYQVGLFFLSLGTAILNAAKALMAFNFAAAIPAVLIGLLVGAIILLVDELMNFYEGNETIIGQLVKDYPNAIYLVWSALSLLVAGLAAFVGGWAVGVAAVAAGIWWLWDNWDEATTFMREAFDDIIETVMGAIGTLEKFFGGIGTVLQAVAAPFSTSLGDMAAAVVNPSRSSGVLGSAARSSAVSSVSNAATTNINGTSITIQTNDPAKAGESVRMELDRMAKNATRNGQSAVAL